MKLSEIISDYMSEIGAKGGAATKGITSEAKAKAARKNGAKGGRPPGSKDRKPRKSSRT